MMNADETNENDSPPAEKPPARAIQNALFADAGDSEAALENRVVKEESGLPDGWETGAAAPVRSFETDVTRAVFSGLIMRPIFELGSRRFRTGDEEDDSAIREDLDLTWLAFAVLDAVSELTEYSIGATRKEVLERVLPLARRQAAIVEANSKGADDKITDDLNKVFDHLVNRGNRYLPFVYSYFDGASESFRERRFWLVKTVFTGQGKEALFSLTDEGYAAYFGLHETGALDAAAIGNLRIKLLIERGKVDDAISVAEQNRKQCMRKAQEVHQARRAIQRNIHSVELSNIIALADEGADQATRVQQESSSLHHMVRNRLHELEDGVQHRKLATLAESLERLNGRLMKLAVELQEIPDDYHRHAHKLFRLKSPGVHPPLDEVMRRICRAKETDAAGVGLEFMARFDPALRKPLFDPATVIEACERALERRKTPGERNQAMAEIEAESIERYKSELTDPLMRRAFEELERIVPISGSVRLSELLESAFPDPEEPLAPVALAMAVFQCIGDRRMARKHFVDVILEDPEKRFSLLLSEIYRYRGHELILNVRRSENNASRDP